MSLLDFDVKRLTKSDLKAGKIQFNQCALKITVMKRVNTLLYTYVFNDDNGHETSLKTNQIS